VRLFLHSLEFAKQEDGSVLDGVGLPFLLGHFRFLLCDVLEDGVIDGQPIDGVELLH
jgi:hypothetical protein